MMRKSRKALLGLTLIVALTGALLLIFGAVYTATTSDTIGTYYGYPIWSPPLPGAPSSMIISANYTLNYAGIAFLLAAIMIGFVSRKSPKPSERSLANDPLD